MREIAVSEAYEFIRTDVKDHCLEVTLNRPDVYNSLHNAAHTELHAAWDAYAADDNLWVAILTGAGEKAFCAGNDLKATASGGGGKEPPTGFGGLVRRYDLEKPIIGAVNGVAMGGGLEIALCCDILIAEESARFALPEVKVGLFAAAGGVQRLSKQIGRKAAVEMMLTGRHVGAAEAKSLGIVNEVVPDGTSLEAARAMAETLLANSPSSIRATKKVLNQMDQLERFDEAIKLSRDVIRDLFQTEDCKEGVQAFVEKRPPQWKNR